tara:strand:- start:255 stop:491 length:237 start_codon:yes stop_codon:yes gene_type:complete
VRRSFDAPPSQKARPSTEEQLKRHRTIVETLSSVTLVCASVVDPTVMEEPLEFGVIAAMNAAASEYVAVVSTLNIHSI